MPCNSRESIVRLEPVTALNWKECCDLAVAPEQVGFLPSNLYSIAESQFYSEACPLAIYNGADHLVGFALYGVDVESGKWKIFRLMIDCAHQGKGHGTAAMREMITRITNERDCDEILVAYQENNAVARRLYRGLGFVEIGTDGSTITAKLDVNSSDCPR